MVILHNAIHDLKVLESMGVFLDIEDVEDTMLIAYNLGNLSRKLKVLAYRLLGIEIKDYEDMLSPYQREATVDYLTTITSIYEEQYEERISRKTGKRLKPRLLSKPDYIRAANRCLRSRDPTELWKNQNEQIHREIADIGIGQLPELTLRDIPEQELINYACRDADVAGQLYPLLYRRLCDMDLLDTYTLDKQCLPIFKRMEEWGFLVNPEHFIQLSRELENIMEHSLRELHLFPDVPPDFNPISGKQVGNLLFNTLELGTGKRLKKTVTGQISTEEPYLQAIKREHPIVPLILAYREAEKLKTAYTDTIPFLLDTDHRYHPDINYIGTVSGRIAERLLILMPKHSSWGMGKKIRHGFIAGQGNLLASFDLSQIELRVLAHCSHDPALLDAYHTGKDLHAMTAHRILGAPEKKELQDESKHRLPAKTLNFAIPMGISADGLVREIQASLAGQDAPQAEIDSWTPSRCQDMLDAWYTDSYKVAGRYLREAALEAEEYGYVRSFDGRIRHLPSIWSPHERIREEAKRQAQSFKMQAGAVSISKQWMWSVWNVVCKHQLAEPIIWIHDDLVMECSRNHLVNVSQAMKKCLPQTLSIPVICEGKCGTNWGELS